MMSAFYHVIKLATSIYHGAACIEYMWVNETVPIMGFLAKYFPLRLVRRCAEVDFVMYQLASTPLNLKYMYIIQVCQCILT